jgi:hypothetical protein
MSAKSLRLLKIAVFFLPLSLVLSSAIAFSPPTLTIRADLITNGAEWSNGLPVALPNVQRPKIESVFISRPGTDWTYSHHPHLAFFKGRLYAIWSNGRKTEDQSGQRVMVSSSSDFTNWTALRPLVDTVRNAAGMEEVLTASGLYQYGNLLIAYVQIADAHKKNQVVWALTTTDGEHWSAPRNLGLPISPPNHGPEVLASGRLIISGNTEYPWSDNPSGLGYWHMAGIGSLPKKAKIRRELQIPPGYDPCEASFYQTDDGIIHMLLRNGVKEIPHRLWLTESRDNGLTWSTPVPTGFSDANSKFHFGRLPDGRFYYVGNPLWHRTPLILSLSRDGVHFNQHYILAEAHHELPKTSDEYGYPAYPTSMVHDGHLYVIVSRDKNKIEMLRVALNELK